MKFPDNYNLPATIGELTKQYSLPLLTQAPPAQLLASAVMVVAFSFHRLIEKYEEKNVILWLSACMIDLNKFNGSHMENEQITDLARLFILKDRSVNVFEFLIFLNEVKMAEYGKFYGSNIRPIDLMEMYQTFLAKRNEVKARVQTDELKKLKNQKEQQEKERLHKAIEQAGVSNSLELYFLHLTEKEVKALPQRQRQKYDEFIEKRKKA